jgi:hypothetical protein
MSMPFIEMPQRAAALRSMTSSPPWPVAPADWDASPEADACVAVDGHAGVLVHAGAVVADVAVDGDLEFGVETTRKGVRAARIRDGQRLRRLRGGQQFVHLAGARRGQVDRDGGASC